MYFSIYAIEGWTQFAYDKEGKSTATKEDLTNTPGQLKTDLFVL